MAEGTPSRFRVEYQQPGAAQWLQAVERFDPRRTKPLKDDGDTCVYLAEIEGEKYIFKRWRLGSLGARMKAAVRMSRAWRHKSGAARLMKAGVRSAACYAIVREHAAGEQYQWLIMEYLAGKTVLQHLHDRDLSVKQEHAVARALGAALAKISMASLWNRDAKPSNWIVVEPDSGEIAAIDTVGVRGTSLRLAGNRSRFQMLASLVIEPTGTGVRPRRALMMRALTASFMAPGSITLANPYPIVKWAWWRTERAVARHGNPVPRVDPLER